MLLEDKEIGLNEIIEIYNNNLEQSISAKIENVIDDSLLENDIVLYNTSVLKTYKYLFADKEKLFTFIDVNKITKIDKEYLCFNHIKKTLSYIKQEQETNSIYNKKFPLFLENVVSAKTLEFLNDVVRLSEECAEDNHIYLYYDNMRTFLLFLHAVDLKKYLTFEKFIFLVGKEQKEVYPIDFKKIFNVDYSAMSIKTFKISEMQRFCYAVKYAYCGIDFGANVLSKSPNVIYMRTWHILELKNKINDVPLIDSAEFQNLLASNIKISANELADYLMRNKEKIHIIWDNVCGECNLGYEELVSKFLELFGEEKNLSITDIFKAWSILKIYSNNENISHKVVPMILFEPHIGRPERLDFLFDGFKYSCQLGSFRDPLKRYASISRKKVFSKWMWGTCCRYSLKKNVPYYAYKFEDLKLYPFETLQTICRKLEIGFDDKMLMVDYAEKSTNGERVKAFELTAVVRPIDDVITILDQCRLRYYYKEFYKYFGYNSFNDNKYDFNDDEIRYMFNIPFKAETLWKDNDNPIMQISPERRKLLA